jgi:AGZA family xanthine/uracil permease-like MFS transporter
VKLATEKAALDAGVPLEQVSRMAEQAAWHAGLAACLASGLIEFSSAFFVERLRRVTPRAALLSTLAGIALAFVSIYFLFRTFARPIVGLTTLAVILLGYFGRVRFRGQMPAGLIAVALGTALAWVTGIAGREQLTMSAPGLRMPQPAFGDVIEALGGGYLLSYLSIVVPMGLFIVIGSMQNIESAEAEGDAYPTAPSLAVNGIGTLAAALFGSCFPTTIYIGHPGWKALGARAGYSVLNAVFMTTVCLTGTAAYVSWAVPVDAAMAIVLWIGIVITAQAFSATPRSHAPAVVLGVLPAIAAWGAVMIKTALRVAEQVTSGALVFSRDLIGEFHSQDVWLHGALALEQGFIFTAMILSAATVMVIERRFFRASAWCWAAAVLSALGLMHSYHWYGNDTTIFLDWPWKLETWPWAVGYGCMALIFMSARWLTASHDRDGH